MCCDTFNLYVSTSCCKYIVSDADGPPKYIRARLYTYHFSAPGSAEWWVREEQGEYLPPLSRDHAQLRDILTRCSY